MAVITQNYDIDLKATGEYPVVKMSQFDTGSRTIVFTVYDGHDLAQIDGMVARVDGTRADGVEFSSTCTVSTGSKVSFTINQEMTKVSGKHTAELVIFDADGNPIGTQNFIIEVETATMMRDSAASADDRTLYDQFTGSVSKTVADKMTSVDSKLAGVDDKMTSVDSKLAGVDDKMAGIDTQISTRVDTEIDKRIKPDPLRGAWSDYTVDGTVNFAGDGVEHVIPLKIKSQSNGADAVYGSATENAIYIYKPGVYQMTVDGFYAGNAEVTNRVTVVKLSSNSDTDGVKRRWSLTGAQGIGTTGGRSQIFRGAITFYVPDDSLPYRICMYTNGSNAVSLTSGALSQVVVTRISSGGDILEKGVNTLKVGKTTTGAPGTQASVVNSGTAKDVVLDFTIPRGDGAYLSTVKQIVDVQKDVRLLVFGDSWTAYYNKYLPTQIAGKLNSSWWKCYGVSGAKLGGIADQIANAGQDSSFDNSTVTHIVIVGGTNNLFDPGNGSDSDTLVGQVKRIISNLTTYYPRAICHYFPDNSRTSNGGRTSQYGVIVECFRQFSCVAVHPETIWILSHNNFELYRTDSSNRENLQHLTRDGYDWLAGYIAGCLRGGDTKAQTVNTETSCDYMYRNDFVQGTSGSDDPVEFIGDLKINSYSPDTLKFEYRDGLAICHARFASIKWNPEMPQASQRYALFDVNTYPINADLDSKWKYADRFKANLAQPRDVILGNGFASTAYKRVYSVSATLEADLYGSLRIKCFVDKGDTTSAWNGFGTISIDFNPYSMF